MTRGLAWKQVLLLVLIFTAHESFGQRGKLMYDSIPRHAPDNTLTFYDYNRHMFFGYDDCTEYIDLKYGFKHEYLGRMSRIGYRVMHYDWLNRRWSRQMIRRNGPNWHDAYYQDLRDCRNEAVFLDFIVGLPDTTFTSIKNITRKDELLRLPPVQFLRYLSTTTQHHGLGSDSQLVALEMRREVKFLVTPQDKWVRKTDVAKLIQFIYADKSVSRRACLCSDTVLIGQPTTLALEAFKLIGLYRGHNYPTSFPSVSRNEVDELFSWWLEERKKP